ncbi:putative hydrolase or acyltransferase of alpha/beta superfamily [Thioflavicoccus mobilis 8321]|uniref:Putative hydrolase or acyltransferase of alpha/beta superfamily n=1 Tax=Thioflavicoccus mobilis 8321 TaxID=765912 RepID=L0GTU3_9GAMM|nr:alpha/beta hydrolase [Thioflavicoccus mobilis]AGA89232.1 putative hydrolase or acyltransferase of alpha/beta superfamily [Thioflavicoccus mobilis 8321]
MSKLELSRSYIFEGRTVKYGMLGDGPPVILVHGTPWSSFNLRHLIRTLSRDFTVYYYDLMGYGQSDKSPGDVSLGIQNQILDHLINHWGLDNPFIIGHDFGGTTVLRTHLINGRDFRGIVLINPVAISPWGSSFFQHVNAHEAAFVGVPDYIHEAIVRAYVKTATFKAIDDKTLDMIVRPWTEPEGKAAFYRQIAQASSSFTDEIQPFYSKISKPVLILWGREDTWIPVEKGEVLHEMIPGSLFHVISDAGHLVIEEQPDKLTEKILPFLQNEPIT